VAEAPVLTSGTIRATVISAGDSVPACEAVFQRRSDVSGPSGYPLPAYPREHSYTVAQDTRRGPQEATPCPVPCRPRLMSGREPT
jgi:hypothetical protein